MPTRTSAPAVQPDAPEHPPVTLSESDGVRYLHLGTVWVQGAMRIQFPTYVELEYVRRMLASLLWLPTERWQAADAAQAAHAAQLGLGAGAITRFTLLELGMHTTAVEINPWVVEVNRRWFRLPLGHPRLELALMDAGQWVRQAEAGSLDLLHVDLYDHEAAAPVLDDEGFYADCRRLLAPGGVMSVNLFGRRASYAASSARIAAAFGADQVWSLQPTREGNTTVVAGQGVAVPGSEALRQRAEALHERFARLGLAPRKWLHMVRPYPPEVA